MKIKFNLTFHHLLKTKRHFIRFVIGCSLSFNLFAQTIQVKVQGITGKVQANVEKHLQALADSHLLASKTPEELQQEAANAMYPFGYFKPAIQLKQQQDVLKVRIDPGPKIMIKQLSIQVVGEGKKNAVINKAIQDLKLNVNTPFISSSYEDAKQSLLNAAEQEGFLRASFDKAKVLIDKNRYTTSIALIFNTGPQYYFGQVKFDPTYISPELLQRYIPFKYGQPYSTDQVLAFNSALSASGYFKEVSLKPLIDTNNSVIPIDVHLQDAARTHYSFGIGYGTDTGIRGRAGYHIVPVNRYGHKFNAVALGSLKENTLQAQYVIPGQNPLTDQYDVLGNFSTLNYSAGYSNSLLLSLAQRHNLANFQRVLSINGLYERFNYNTQPKEETYAFFPKATFTWTNHGNELFTPTGYNVTLNTLAASKALLSEVSFGQVFLNAKAALMVDSWRTRFYVHGMQGFTAIKNINEMPLSLALLLGGADNLKAYSYNSIGPGKILTFGSAEIQKETFDNWYVLGFADSGSVYKPVAKNWYNDIGLGLMWVSPIGPIKVGVAHGLDSRFKWDRDQKFKLVISMGPDL